MLASRDIVETIVGEIDVQNPDIVVMGSHGLTAIKSLLMGSVTSGVLRKSTTPVLVVK